MGHRERFGIEIPSASAFLAPGAQQAIEKALIRKAATKVATHLLGPTPPQLKAALLAWDLYTLVSGTNDVIQAPAAFPNGLYYRCMQRECGLPAGWPTGRYVAPQGGCAATCLDNQFFFPPAGLAPGFGDWLDYLDQVAFPGTHRGSLIAYYQSFDGLAHEVTQVGTLYLGHGTTLRELADPGLALNPNLMRRGLRRTLKPDLNEMPNPWEDEVPGVTPAEWVEVHNVEEIPNVTDAPDIATRVTISPTPGVASAPGTGVGVDPGTDPGVGEAPGTGESAPVPGGLGGYARSVTHPPRTRVRTRRSKEKKFKSWGVAIFKAMDIASEAGDAVAAIYDALPTNVKRKWDKKCAKSVENFGQYGTSGLECHLPAIWHNFDKIDWPQAIVNLIANEAEDQLIGRAGGALPPGGLRPYFTIVKETEKAKGQASR